MRKTSELHHGWAQIGTDPDGLFKTFLEEIATSWERADEFVLPQHLLHLVGEDFEFGPFIRDHLCPIRGEDNVSHFGCGSAALCPSVVKLERIAQR